MATRDHTRGPGFVEACEFALAGLVVAFLGFFLTLGLVKAYEILDGAALFMRRCLMSKSKNTSKPTKSKAASLRLTEDIVSYDTIVALQHLEDLARSGDCIGIAFGAILRGDKSPTGILGRR